MTISNVYFKYILENLSCIVIEQKKTITFTDNPSEDIFCKAWGGCAKKLENTFHGQYFLDYYFNKKMKAVFGNTTQKENGYEVRASQFIQ